MPRTRILMMSSAFALVGAVPAFADLTAQQVIDDYLKQLRLYGFEVDVINQVSSPGKIEVEGFSMAASMPEGDFRFSVPGGVFTELGDGSVEVTYPDVMPMAMDLSIEGEEDVSFSMNFVQTNTQMNVSGIPEEIRYAYSSDKMALQDFEITEPREAEDLEFGVSFEMLGLSGVSQFIGGGTVRDMDAEVSIDSIAMTFSAKPEDDDMVDFSLEGRNFETAYSGKVAPQDVGASLADTILAGNETKGTLAHGALSYGLQVEGPDGALDVAAEIASGEIDFNMDRDGLAYGGAQSGISTTVGGSMIPFPPMTFKIAESDGRFAMPVVPSDDEQEFALRMAYRGIELDPMIWGMFDPAGQLPRDLINLVIDLDGLGVLSEDIFDPEFAEQATEVPGELIAVNLRELL